MNLYVSNKFLHVLLFLNLHFTQINDESVTNVDF